MTPDLATASALIIIFHHLGSRPSSCPSLFTCKRSEPSTTLTSFGHPNDPTFRPTAVSCAQRKATSYASYLSHEAEYEELRTVHCTLRQRCSTVAVSTGPNEASCVHLFGETIPNNWNLSSLPSPESRPQISKIFGYEHVPSSLERIHATTAYLEFQSAALRSLDLTFLLFFATKNFEKISLRYDRALCVSVQ